MELSRRNRCLESRRRVAIARRRRPPRCGWPVRCVLNWAPSTGRYTGWPANWATASSRSGPWCAKPTSTTDIGPGYRLLSQPGSKNLSGKSENLSAPTKFSSELPVFSGGARPPTQEIVAFIDAQRGEFGVEPVCTVLRSAGVSVAPSTYSDAKNRPTWARARDAELRPALVQLWEDNYRVYGARKLWKAARRAGHDVGRDQVARHMRAAGIVGVRRGKRVRTTKPDLTAGRHPDLVQRKFTADAPNRLWVSDLTFVPTWAGVAYVCFIVDAYSRTIVGWRVASHMRTTMVLDAIEMCAPTSCGDRRRRATATTRARRRTGRRSSAAPSLTTWPGATKTRRLRHCP
jgi:putative transposase